jgi:hypothetical protein
MLSSLGRCLGAIASRDGLRRIDHETRRFEAVVVTRHAVLRQNGGRVDGLRLRDRGR